MPILRWGGAQYIDLSTGQPVGKFIPGVTEPQFDLTSMRGNVGNKPGVELTPYAGSVTNGVAQLTGPLYENILFTSVVDIRSNATLRNCRIVIPSTYTESDSIAGAVRALIGSTVNNVTLEDCEIHNRAQRPLNGIMGRNVTVRRTVVTGCIDGFSDSLSGDSTQTYGFRIYDSIVADSAWWYTPTVNSIIHPSDTQSHGDSIQKGTTLPTVVENTVFAAYLSDFVGTGTVGSGSESNPYVPASGFNFIATQAQMEAWKDEYGNLLTDPESTRGGISRRLPSSGGSLAAVMVNRDGASFDHCYFGGGIATVNLLDTNLPANMDVTVKDSKFWQDSKSGGAILIPTGKTATLTGNTWAVGGGNVAPTYI